MQRRLDPETGVNKPFENVSCQGRIQNFFFFREGAPIFVTFSNVVFFGRFNFKQLLCTKNDSRGSEGMLPRKILKICILKWPFYCFLNNF